MLTFLTGGVRSGKSALAVHLAERLHRERTGAAGVTFVATCPRIPGDDDLDARITAHRRERPAGWTTVEEPHDLTAVLAGAGADCVVVDCLTLWVSNLMWRGDGDDDIVRAGQEAALVAAGRPAPTIVVSNEVGWGIHPSTEAGRRYREVLGRVNQAWARAADRALLCVAGRVVELRDPELHDPELHDPELHDPGLHQPEGAA